MNKATTMNAIGYVRVSTQKQGASGLGMEAQQTAINAHVKASEGRLIKTYIEVESGKDNERPQLHAALLHAKRSRAILVVGKLDRLSRNAHFLTGLMESKVPFVACDNPNANELTIGILAIIAQHEAQMISARTKAALQAAKARGIQLGSAREGHWEGREEVRLQGLEKGRVRSAKVRQELARKAHEELCPVILALRTEGLTLQQMADKLNADGWRTRQGKEWNTVYVCRFLKQCE